MLEGLRSFVGSWVAKVLLVLLVASFAVWGISGDMFGGANSNTVASVGETKISAREYLAIYNRNINRASQRFGRHLTQDQARALGVEQQAISDAVTGATLDEYAREMNMALSEDTLASMIRDNPAFHNASGDFDRLAFQSAVRQAGMRESDFVESQSSNAVRSQLMGAIADGDMLPKVFTNAMGEFVSEERKFDYFVLTPALAGTKPSPTDEDLKTFFEATKATYRAPEYRKISILAIKPADIADESSIDQAAIQAEYEARINAFRQNEKRQVQQIVLTKEKAEEAQKLLADGGTFEQVLEANNVKIADADLGLIEKSRLPQAFQDVAFNLPLNEVSEPVDGPFGPTLLRVVQINEESTKPLSEVQDEIKKDLALSLAADRVIELQTEVEDIRAGGTGLEAAADQVGLKVRVIDAVDRNSLDVDGKIINDIPLSAEVLRQAFETEIGEQSSPLDYESVGYLWYEVLDVIEARDRTLDEVTEKVRADWVTKEEAIMVEKRANELVARLEGGASIQDVALSLGIGPIQTGFLKRGGAEATYSQAATNAGFGGDENTIASADGIEPNTKIVLKVAEVKRAEAEKPDVPADQVRLANAGAANDLLQQFIGNLQSNYSVTTNPTLLQQVLAHR